MCNFTQTFRYSLMFLILLVFFSSITNLKTLSISSLSVVSELVLIFKILLIFILYNLQYKIMLFNFPFFMNFFFHFLWILGLTFTSSILRKNQFYVTIYRTYTVAFTFSVIKHRFSTFTCIYYCISKSERKQ